MKHKKRKQTKLLKRNNSILGDTIEITVERLMQGEGEDGIEDRDLVYNDGESSIVNPITNIRSDKFELMADEKIGEYEHKHRKLKTKEEIGEVALEKTEIETED